MFCLVRRTAICMSTGSMNIPMSMCMTRIISMSTQPMILPASRIYIDTVMRG